MRFTDLIRGGKPAPQGSAREEKSEEKRADAATPSPPPQSSTLNLRMLAKPVEQEKPSQQQEAPGIQLSTLVREASHQTALPDSPAPDWYSQAEVALMNIESAVRNQTPFPLGEVRRIAKGFVASLAKEDTLLARAISRPGGPSLIGNMIDVAIYAIKIGAGLGYRPEELHSLALAALVHDIGMFRLPDQVLNQQGRWNKEQIAVMKRHPILGAELLKQAAPDDPWLAEVVSQEHERIGGSGYPRGLRGAQIHEFALVIGIADVLDAMLRSRVTRKALLPHEAVRLMILREKSNFPVRIMKSLVQQMSLFPIGTWIKLTSGEIGEVVQSNPRFPLRPLVRIAIDARGLRLREPRELDLSRNPLIHVSEIVEVAARLSE